jgi:ribonuclease HII
MLEWDSIYPRYGLARHKGYGTPEHLAALEEFGPTPQHRGTFEPVRRQGPFIWAEAGQ